MVLSGETCTLRAFARTVAYYCLRWCYDAKITSVTASFLPPKTTHAPSSGPLLYKRAFNLIFFRMYFYLFLSSARRRHGGRGRGGERERVENECVR